MSYCPKLLTPYERIKPGFDSMNEECSDPCDSALQDDNSQSPSSSELPANRRYRGDTRSVEKSEYKEYKGRERSEERIERSE